MTMARTPDNTNRDDLEALEQEALSGMINAAQKGTPEPAIIPALPPVSDRIVFPSRGVERQAPTTPISFAPHPNFSVPTNTTDSDSLSATTRTPTSTDSVSDADLSAIEESFFMNEDADAPKAADLIRMAIRDRGDTHFLSIRNQPTDQSTIFSAITGEFRDGNISEEEAFSLMCEYTDSLTPDEKFSVFTDILVAESNGSISEAEAKNYAKALDLSSGDKIVLGSLSARLLDEQPPVEIPALSFDRREERDTAKKDNGVYSIGRLFSNKLVLAAGLVLALGSTIKMGYNIGQKNESSVELATLLPEPSVTPVEAQATTHSKITAVKSLEAPKEKEITPTAPKARMPSSPIAPKIRVSPVETPVAPKIIPSVEKVETISLPITTKPNRDGSIVVDEAKSLTVWKKLGYTVGIKKNPAGKVFILTNSEGKKIAIPADGLEKGQTSVEVK